jgi:release factor glutamine methyltransferase
MSKADSELWTIQKVLFAAVTWLKEKSIDRLKVDSQPRLEAELLLSHILCMTRMQLYLNLDRPLDIGERESFKDLLRRRAQGEPVNYIIGRREFYRHSFLVGPGVLVPRPDTEILVEEVSKLIATSPQDFARTLDIGTGTGCIGISLALAHPELTVVGWDISDEALSFSKKNAAALKALNFDVVKQDCKQYQGNDQFDVIVSNPPYIKSCDRETLSETVKSYEPEAALFDLEAEDGLAFYRIITKLAKEGLLRRDGYLAFETGFDQTQDVSSIMDSFGFLSIRVVQDLAGQPRVVIGKLS